MKKFALFVLLSVLPLPAWATTYYLAPASSGGSDFNNGTSASTPWLSPNHSVNCGDVIIAAPSAAYSAPNFDTGEWGTVTCPGNNNVAWLVCAKFDACRITTSGLHAMQISASYWGVQGWEATVTGGAYYACFDVTPPGNTTIHHIILANDIANGCYGSGFQANPLNSAGVDYFVVVGSIAYNAARGNGECFSGISDAGPINSDSLPGTHVYIAGNFSWGNFDPNPCAGGTPSDGEGIILDTYNGSGTGKIYTGQSVVANNMVLSNGGRGIQAFLSPTAKIYIYQNTTWNNEGDTSQNATDCGEILLNSSLNTQVYQNIAVTTSPSGCGTNPVYAYFIGGGNASDIMQNNWGYSPSGNYCGTNPAFTCGPSNTFSNPKFANPMTPGPPNCAASASVPACMASVVANFTPAIAAAKGYGYQVPSNVQPNDPLFPQWLCNVNLPTGLVTMGCASAGVLPDAPTITTVTVQ